MPDTVDDTFDRLARILDRDGSITTERILIETMAIGVEGIDEVVSRLADRREAQGKTRHGWIVGNVAY